MEKSLLERLIERTPVWVDDRGWSGKLYSAMRFVRNFNSYPFPEKLKTQGLDEVESIIDISLNKFGDSGSFEKVEVERLSELQYLILKERAILPELKSSERSKIKLYIFDDLRTFIVTNFRDHISLVRYSRGSLNKQSRDYLESILSSFNDELFAHSSEHGFLSSNLRYTGTGFKTYAGYNIPYIRESGFIKELTNNFDTNGFIYTRSNNFSTDKDDLLIVTNKESIGCNIDQYISNQVKLDSKVKEMDSENRERLLQSEVSLDIIADSILKKLERDSLDYRSFLEIYFKLLILKDNNYQYFNISNLKRYYYLLTRGGISQENDQILSTLDCNRLRLSKIKSLIVG